MSLYPAILTDSVGVVQASLDVCQPLPMIETVQIDIIDGNFSDNLTVTPADLVDIEWGGLQCDFHLMTDEPMDIVFEVIEFQKRLPVRAIIGQVERMSLQLDFLSEVTRHEWKAGLSLDIYTPLDAIDEECWRAVQIIQLMAVEAGSQGQVFKPQVLSKLDELQQIIAERQLSVEVIVDGGVTTETIAQLSEHGVQHFAVGSALWTASNLPQTAATLASYTE